MYHSGGASLLLFERDKSEQEQQRREEKQYKKATGQRFRVPKYAKGLPFAILIVFQFVLSMSYLTPIYFMERKCTRYFVVMKQLSLFVVKKSC